MKHARSDYYAIQDPTGRIPADEPVFLLRGQDAVAADVVRFWAQCAFEAGADEQIATRAMNWADEMESWAKKKVPDMPSDA